MSICLADQELQLVEVLQRPGFCRGRWTIQSRNAVAQVVKDVAGMMSTHGFPEQDVFAVRLALEEALVNAVRHGNVDDPAKIVCIRYFVNDSKVTIRIRDEGSGFNPRAVPDPVAPENLERPSGRGVLLIRKFMSSVRYNRRGNAVTLVKVRADSLKNGI